MRIIFLEFIDVDSSLPVLHLTHASFLNYLKGITPFSDNNLKRVSLIIISFSFFYKMNSFFFFARDPKVFFFCFFNIQNFTRICHSVLVVYSISVSFQIFFSRKIFLNIVLVLVLFPYFCFLL